jgi:hypothetical protein
MEIERACLSDEASQIAWQWWERWFADREERLRFANEQAARRGGRRPRTYLPIPEQRTRYQIGPNGELTPAA